MNKKTFIFAGNCLAFFIGFFTFITAIVDVFSPQIGGEETVYYILSMIVALACLVLSCWSLAMMLIKKDDSKLLTLEKVLLINALVILVVN